MTPEQKTIQDLREHLIEMGMAGVRFVGLSAMRRLSLATLNLVLLAIPSHGAVLATANWYVRAGGNELNGGGYDAAISGAGTNYADQDAAQLSLTDIASAQNSLTVTSVTGGFT